MNVLPKGIFPVVMATTTASVLILAFGNTAADSGKNITVEGAAIEVATEKLLDSKEVAVSESTSQKIGAILSDDRAVLASPPPPPPGPFIFNDSVSSNSANEANTSSLQSAGSVAVEAFAPSLDGIQSVQQNVSSSIGEKAEGIVGIAAPEFKKAEPSTPVFPVTSIQAPSLDRTQAAEPKRPVNLVLKDVEINEPKEPLNTVSVPTEVTKQTIVAQAPKIKQPKLNEQESERPPLPVVNLKEPKIQKAVVQEIKEQVAPTKMDVVMAIPTSPEQAQVKKPSEPILNVKRPTNLHVQPHKPKMQVKSRQAPISSWQNNSGIMVQAPQQYMYIPMPVYNSGFIYPPMLMNNERYYAPNLFYGMPSAFTGGNSQMEVKGVQTPNVEIK